MPTGTPSIWNLPSGPVAAPREVPTTSTFAAGRGSPVTWSSTSPWIRPDWAWAEPVGALRSVTRSISGRDGRARGIQTAFLFASGEWRRRLFLPRRDARSAWQTLLHDLRIRREPPAPVGLYNGMQRLAYTAVLAAAPLLVLSGLALYKPVQLPRLTALLGGYDAARAIHLGVLAALALFLVVHVVTKSALVQVAAKAGNLSKAAAGEAVNAVFDAIVSYEVIEHIPNVTLYLAEIHRLAHAPAKVFISTPNRRLRLLPFQKPWNRYHLREYAPADFAATLQRIFPRVRILGVSAPRPNAPTGPAPRNRLPLSAGSDTSEQPLTGKSAGNPQPGMPVNSGSRSR